MNKKVVWMLMCIVAVYTLAPVLIGWTIDVACGYYFLLGEMFLSSCGAIGVLFCAANDECEEEAHC